MRWGLAYKGFYIFYLWVKRLINHYIIRERIAIAGIERKRMKGLDNWLDWLIDGNWGKRYKKAGLFIMISCPFALGPWLYYPIQKVYSIHFSCIVQMHAVTAVTAVILNTTLYSFLHMNVAFNFGGVLSSTLPLWLFPSRNCPSH